MAKKEESIGKVNAPDRLDMVYLTANKRANDLGVGLKLTKPDSAKMTTAMGKTQKPAEYFFVYDNYALWVELRAGGTVLTAGSIDFKKEKDVVKRRALLDKVRGMTSLVTTADLAAFDKAFPAPPDPVKLAALQTKITELTNKRERFKSDRDSATYNYKDYDRMDDASGKEFQDWLVAAKEQKYIAFLGSVDDKQPGGFIIIKFLKNGGEYFLNLPAPMVAKIVKSHRDTGGGTVDFKAARAWALAKVNDVQLKAFNKAKKDALNAQIKTVEDELKPKLLELKKMTGR